jgi:2'-5' RNA ligase
MSERPDPESSYIGVTIELPEPFRRELTAWRTSLGDPSAAKIPPHITLLPPTRLEPALRVKFSDHLASVAASHQPFRVRLSGSGTFRPISPVVFVVLIEGADGCASVQEAVCSGPVIPKLQFGYHPHVTIAHDLPDTTLDEALEALSGFEAEFEATGFQLFERDDDGYWRAGREFTFGQPTINYASDVE